MWASRQSGCILGKVDHMRVLILANYDAGLYKFRRELLEALIKEHEVFFCVPDGEYVEHIKALGCQYVPCDLLNRHGTNPLAELKLLMLYKKYIKDLVPDVVLTYTIKPNIYGGMACAGMGVPYIANVTGLGTAVENPGVMQKVAVSLYRYGLRKARRVYFQNEENLDFMLKRHMIRGAYSLLPGSGVNLMQFQLMEYPPEDRVEFAFISRVMKEKGIEQYLEAARFIREKYPHTIFHICGAYEQDYKVQIDRLQSDGVVVYHGIVQNMAEIYEKIACTVHPTYYPEGMSNVLLESCACGRPIITTGRAGCREIVDDGVNGYTVKQQDSNDLIEKMEKFLALNWDERRQMGLSGRKLVEQKFDRQIVIDAYMKEIRKIEEIEWYRENL